MMTTEVGVADRSKLLLSKRAECSAIVTSRKRKLRELFAVATEVDGIPNFDFSDPDAPPATQAETKFLFDSDILQGRKFNELNIPPRPQIRPDILQRLLATAPPSTDENAVQQTSKPAAEPSFKPSLPADTGFGSASPAEHAALQVPSSTEPAAKAGTPQPSVHDRETAIGALPNGDTAEDGQGHASQASNTAQRPTAVASESSPDLARGIRKGVSPAPDIGDGGQDHQNQESTQNAATAELAVEDAAEPMDIDGPVTTRKKDGNAHLSIPTPSADHSKAPDALSSPASTTHTAMTPAVHEASTDTSPDNEGPQYIEAEEEKAEEEKAEEAGTPNAHRPSDDESRDVVSGSDAVAGPERAQSPAHVDALGRVVDGVEAQLLEETAAASMAKANGNATRSPGPSSPTAVAERTLASPTERPPQSEALSKPSPAKGGVPPDHTAATPGTTPGEPATTDREGRQASEVVSTAVPVEPLPRIDTSAPPSGPDLSTDTPTIEVSAPAVETSASQRAVTRISSGVLRQKSVSELLGEAPKEAPVAPLTPGPSGSPKSLHHMQDDDEPLTPAVSVGQVKSLASRTREKRRRSIPTVVFGKQPKKLKPSDDTALVSGQPKEGVSMNDDYFIPLFLDAFSRSERSWMKPVDQLLNQAHKTVSTPDQYIPIQEQQACRILRRVYHLQQQDKWSLRQPQRCPEPTRPPSHRDILLQEMKWMRTDFREEAKWKRAVARNLARDCAEWVAAGPEERLALQVNAVIPPRAASMDVVMQDEAVDAPEDQLPDLIHSDSPTANEDDNIEDRVIPDTIAPSAIFALPDDEVVFGLRPSPIADQLLEELPMYGSPLKVPKFDVTVPEFDPDAHWRRPALPLSKLVEGEMVLSSQPPPRKRSRYSYQAEDDDDDDQIVFGAQPDVHVVLPPVDANVALFNAEMKPIRDRLHAGHQFRPPTEYPMPLQSFYECRTASQWTLAEDDELKSLVREYSYNWSLISSAISSKSVFSSAPERRTPWECFERWVQLEGLPADMGKTQYFRTYQNRIDAAQRIIHQLNQNAQQTVGPNGALTPAPRRRQTLSIRVERRRNQKHLALIDAMRKLAKKREVAVQKTQHAAAMAANRKQNEGQRPVGPPQTPRDYSLMRWERDQQLAEKMAQLAQRQHDLTQQRRAQLARSQSQGTKISTPTANGQAQVAPNAAQMAAATSAGRLSVPGQLAVPGQGRPRMAMPGTPNAAMAAVQAQMGGGLVPPMPMAGLPQAQMQALQAQHRLPMNNATPDINLVLQARRIQDQQRAAVMQQQQQQQQQQQNQQQQQQNQQPHVQHPPQQHQQQHPHPQQQHQQAGQQMQQMQANGNGGQGSPNAMRHMVNGAQGAINQQQHYLANNPAAMMAAFNAANAAGMSSPGVGAGLSMPNMGARSPRPTPFTSQVQMPANIGAQIRELENKFRAQFPNHTADDIRNMAMEHLGRVIARQQHLNQSAMNAAAGAVAQQVMANGITATTSPHQYAQLLRAQQQAQAAAQVAAQAQQQAGHQRQSSGSQPRQSSGSATPTAPAAGAGK